MTPVQTSEPAPDVKEQPASTPEKKEAEVEQPSSTAATAVKETETNEQTQAPVEPQQAQQSQQTMEPQKQKPQQTHQPQQTQQSAVVSDAVDTSLAVLEARCKRFGIPFDPSKYTKRTNARPSKSEVWSGCLF